MRDPRAGSWQESGNPLHHRPLHQSPEEMPPLGRLTWPARPQRHSPRMRPPLLASPPLVTSNSRVCFSFLKILASHSICALFLSSLCPSQLGRRIISGIMDKCSQSSLLLGCSPDDRIAVSWQDGRTMVQIMGTSGRSHSRVTAPVVKARSHSTAMHPPLCQGLRPTGVRLMAPTLSPTATWLQGCSLDRHLIPASRSAACLGPVPLF